MAVSFRLDARTERALNAAARRHNRSRSDVVRDAIVRYEAREDDTTGRRPYDAWMDVIGVVALGARQPASTTGEQFTAILRTPARARRPR